MFNPAHVTAAASLDLLLSLIQATVEAATTISTPNLACCGSDAAYIFLRTFQPD